MKIIKNTEHSINIFILKLLRKEYNRVFEEIEKKKQRLKDLFCIEKVNENSYVDSLKKIHFIDLKYQRKELNKIAKAIKVQKKNIKMSNIKYNK